MCLWSVDYIMLNGSWKMQLIQMVQQWGIESNSWDLYGYQATKLFTIRAPIRDHCIFWGHPISTMAHLVISRQHILGPCELRLEVYQELGGSRDTTPIGSLTINLSEYASSGLTTRRYLLDECKFNSTIKVNKKKTPPHTLDAYLWSSIDVPAILAINQNRSEVGLFNTIWNVKYIRYHSFKPYSRFTV
jgi:hypothetical protein